MCSEKSHVVDTVTKVVNFIRAKSKPQAVCLTVGRDRAPLPHKREIAEFGEVA
jgi:hypothetical protein